MNDVSGSKLLLIEDEDVIINFLQTVLKSNGYEVYHTDTGKQGIDLAISLKSDMVLLDLGLPDMDGMDVLSEIRKVTDLPVIIVSARQNEKEIVQALDKGANDYVTKPFGNNELLARIRSTLRQYRKSSDEVSRHVSEFSVGDLRIDYSKRIVLFGDNRIKLTPTEYKLMVLLSQNSGKVLTHDFMIKNIWGPNANDSQVLRVNMANIRRKIEPNPADPVYILTEVGVGYRLIDSDEQ